MNKRKEKNEEIIYAAGSYRSISDNRVEIITLGEVSTRDIIFSFHLDVILPSHH